MPGFDDYAKTRDFLRDQVSDVAALWGTFKNSRPPVAEQSQPGVDPVSAELAEASARLDRALIEVGVFGDIKRGKSTLLNAMLGLEVSSMDVTPETAVPVYVEQGAGDAVVVFDDGSSEVVSVAEAVEMATQRDRKRRKDKRPTVVRVVQRVESDLLKSGVRLVDTPGLSDPSAAEVYEELTLAELDRVAAAVVVFLIPPVIARNEVELLKSLRGRRVDKTFLVCNFYPDIWSKPEKVEKVLDYISGIVADGDTDPKAVRLYPVEALAAWEARRKGDDDAFEESGVAELMHDLEDYLTEGALTLLANTAGGHLERARGMIRARVTDRLALVTDPGRLAEVTANRRTAVEAAHRRTEELCERVDEGTSRLGDELAKIAVEPFDQALADLAQATRKSDLQRMSDRWAVRVETMISRTTGALDVGVAGLAERTRREVVAAFEASVDFIGSDVTAGYSLDADSPVTAVHVQNEWGVGALVAGGAAVAGGALSGGAGLALLGFLGPAGFAVGAIIAAVCALGGWKLWDGQIPAQVRADVTDQIRTRRQEAVERAAKAARTAGEGINARARELADGFSADVRAELAAVESFTADATAVATQVTLSEEILAGLEGRQS